MNPKNFVQYPIAQAVAIPDGLVNVFRDRYWVVVEECLQLYRGYSPQCNVSQGIAEKLASALMPGSEVKVYSFGFYPRQR